MSITTERKAKYLEAAKRAQSWIVSHQQPDGGFGAVETMSHYMAVPGSLLYAGHARAAAKLVPFMKQRFILPDGSFDMPEYQAGRASALFEYCYAPSWVIFGAHLNLAFDLSLPAMPHILAFQDAGTGGMFGKPEDKERGKGLISAPVSCIAGQAAITTGYIGEAKRMGDHLIDNVIANNPDLNTAFYPAWDTERGLRTDEELPNFPNMPRVILRDQPNQHHYLTGMIIAYMSDLYRATGERKYLDAALTIYRFAAGSTGIYESTLSHKFAWGCAWLYRATGNAEHLESACRICDYLIDIQEADGTFVHWGLVKTSAEWPYSPRLNTTAQFSLWINRTADLL
jgi:hypothetical protein